MTYCNKENSKNIWSIPIESSMISMNIINKMDNFYIPVLGEDGM